MKRIALIALFAALVIASVASAAPAQANPMVSIGVESHGGDTHTYVYGELGLTPSLALSVHYGSNEEFAVGFWQGVVQGLYGELTTVSDSDNLVELGVWRAMSLAPSIGLTGWIGGQSEMGGTGLWAQAGAEFSLDVADSVALFAGGEISLLKKNGESLTWLGVGYYF